MTIRDPMGDGIAAGWKVLDASLPDAPRALEADVVIVGSGAGGGIAAEILTAAGLEVIPGRGRTAQVNALTSAPSPGENEIQFGYTSLYLLLADGRSRPRLLIERRAEQEVFFNPTWSPDGQQLYFSHVMPLDEENFTYTTTLERLDVATGEIIMLAEDAIWPRLSPNGRTLAYIHIDRDSLAAELVLAASDGSNAIFVVPQDRFLTLDTPFFSVDGQWLYFSAVSNQTSSAKWWERLLGIEVAAAHNLPSLWWRLPVTGGVPEQLTTEAQVGQYGAVSPDGRFVAFSSRSGIYLMQPDGSNLRPVLTLSAPDSLSWSL